MFVLRRQLACALGAKPGEILGCAKGVDIPVATRSRPAQTRDERVAPDPAGIVTLDG